MWAVLGFLLASTIGVAAALYVARLGAVRRREYPWLLEEVAKLHVGIVGILAGFAFTGVILVVTFAHERNAAGGVSLDTVIVMFLVAYLYWVGAAFLISYLPHISGGGDFMQRVHFSLASTIEYRTVFLSWFALLPLLRANGLGHLIPSLYFFLPASLFIGSILLAMATDGLGMLAIKETYASAAVAALLALLYAAIVAFIGPGARSSYSGLYLAVIIFCINGLGFGLAAITPLAARYAGIKRFYDRFGRQIVVADMQLTMVSLTFLWLAVVDAI
jgi:hypothetical protein